MSQNIIATEHVAPRTITIVAALSCEVKPIVDALRLVKQLDRPYKVFGGEFESQRVEVLVSGIGALAMATAIGWMAGRQPTSERVWLNLGSAGHGSASLGSAFRVHASSDILSERKYYPAMVAKSVLATDEILSVNAPSSDYPDLGGIDMEAYAFFTAAYRFSSTELVESIKVVSDNPNNDISELNAAKISELIAAHSEVILNLGIALVALLPIKEEQVILEIPELHLTHSQRRQAKVLITKLSTLEAIDDALNLAVSDVSSGAELLSILGTALLNIEPRLDMVENLN